MSGEPVRRGLLDTNIMILWSRIAPGAPRRAAAADQPGAFRHGRCFTRPSSSAPNCQGFGAREEDGDRTGEGGSGHNDAMASVDPALGPRRPWAVWDAASPVPLSGASSAACHQLSRCPFFGLGRTCKGSFP